MRHFPSSAGSRLAAGVVSAVLALTCLSAVPAGAGPDDSLKDKQKRVQKQKAAAEEDLHSSSQASRKAAKRLTAAKRQLGAAQGRLAAAETKVTQAKELDAKMQAELEQAEAELAEARTELRRGKRRMGKQQDSVAATITDFYQQGDPSLIAFASLLDASTPADLARQSEMRNAIVERESQSYQELVATKVLLDVHKQQVKKAKDAVAVKRQAAADHLVAMKELEDQAQTARDAVAEKVTEAGAAQREADAARAADQAALDKLEAEEAKIAAVLRRRALARKARQTPSGSSGGVLAAPVAGGRLSSPYGMRQHPIYGYWGMHDGQDWAVGCGTPLRATANGKIVSKYWSDVYGNRLVLDHGIKSGVGLASVYNHATRYTVGVGQRVTRGQVIGYVGSTGWSTGCHLHFTVMVNGRTTDPRKWL